MNTLLPLLPSRGPSETPEVETRRDIPHVRVPEVLVGPLAACCGTTMTGHRWSVGNVRAAHDALCESAARDVIASMTHSLARHPGSLPGWAVLELPPEMDDEDLQRAAAGLLAALGQPFYSIHSASWLWIGQESSSEREPDAFGGVGGQRLHIDAPNVERPPDYTCLLILRPDPAGGGASLVGDLQAAMADMSQDDRAELARPVFFEGRAVGLSGTGKVRMPFPVLSTPGSGWPWIRWAGKMINDPRNPSDLLPVLRRFADALSAHTRAVLLQRGELLIADQQRVAHGRTPLGNQTGLPHDSRRLLLQAMVAAEPGAPAQVSGSAGGRPQ